MKHVFIVGYGRSGTTVLQNLLNAHDGYCIRGESKAVLAALALSVARARNAVEKFASGDKGKSSPFYGLSLVDPDRFQSALAVQYCQEFIRPPQGTRVCGCKEISITSEWLDDAEFEYLIDFLLAGFEDAHVLFVERDANEVAKSGWWAKMDLAEVQDVVKTCNERFAKARSKHRNRTMILDYSEFNANVDGFRRVLSWLSEPIDEEILGRISSQRLMHLKKGPHELKTKLRRLGALGRRIRQAFG